jgi:hypothetical protein
MQLNDIVGSTFSEMIAEQNNILSDKKLEPGTWAVSIIDESRLFPSGVSTKTFSVAFATGNGQFTTGNAYYNKNQAIQSAIDLATQHDPPIILKGALDILSSKSKELNVAAEPITPQKQLQIVKKYTLAGPVYVNKRDYDNPRKVIIPIYTKFGIKIDETNCTPKQLENLTYIGVHKKNLFDSQEKAKHNFEKAIKEKEPQANPSKNRKSMAM